MPDDIATTLRAAGLRVTAPRLGVYAAVAAHPHSDAETVREAVLSQLGSVSTQGVYDALRVLTEQGLLRRIEPAGSPARYETRIGDNHHHVVCRSCGITGDVDCAINVAPCLEASNPNGFLIDEAEVVYWGLCPACQTTASPHPHVSPARPASLTSMEGPSA